jgi:Cu/Ag efflux protein CusF
MNSLISRFIITIAAVGLLTSHAPADEKTKEKPKFYNEITALDAGAKTVTVYHSPSKSVTYKVTGTTKINVDHKPGKFEDLKEGMKILAVSHEGDSDEATSVSAETIKVGRGYGKKG